MTEDMQKSIHHIRGSVILLSLRVLGILFFVDTVFALVLAFALFAVGSEYYLFVVTFLWLLHTVKFLLEIYLVLSFVLPWATTTYYIVDHQLVQYGGIIKINEKTYELAKLREVDLIESWLGKLLNYGTIHGVISASGYNDEFKLVGIGDVKKYERILREYLTEASETK